MRVVMLFLFFIWSCGQTNVVKQTAENQAGELQYDTNKIAILPSDSVWRGADNNITATTLTNEDLKTINQLLNECINKFNSKHSSREEYSWYIDLEKYRFQYVAFIDSTGDRKVFVFGFCNRDMWDDPNYWKKHLLMVSDGGSCYFGLTINLMKKTYNGFGVNSIV